jgi:hypothetical protein
MGYIIVELSQSDSTLQVSAARIIYGCGRIGTEFFPASGAQKCFNNWLRRELEQGSVPQALSGVPLHGLRDPPKSNLSSKRDDPHFGGLRYSLLVVNSHEENRNDNALSHGNKT